MYDKINAFTNKIDEDYAYNIAYTLAYDDDYMSNELGFRTAGSDAEHAADYLVEQMKVVGLSDVQKEGVTVDKWQFNGASLSLNGSETDILIASYATSGTDSDGIASEIINVGNGFASAYENINVTGKIVLAGIDQYNEYWINSFLEEAHLHGAAALITYAKGGYASISEDAINMQDVCCDNLMPCVSISKKDAEYLIDQISQGNNSATLTVDNEVA